MNPIRVTASVPLSSLRTIASSSSSPLTSAAGPALLLLPRHARSSYATHHQQRQENEPESRRRAVTPFNDDGHVPWTQLSAAEKAGRAAQQTFNFGLVILGVALTGGVAYVMYTEVFSPDSKTTYFNRAVDRIKKDPRCLELLGDSKKITAYGEETHNKWRRARPIASTVTKDGNGNEHMLINFNVQGPKASGRVNIHLIKRAGQSDYEYKYFFLDARGHQRIYLENADAAAMAAARKKSEGFKMFGIRWT
ncbi:mitochondrial import inner membrane translocase subunit tim21 [Podospora australis]|uniref:Mitochondrial import inner membrane translocase subunit Tim21 n=1 Tax=Podospora australis TaxID=1536484 RepID=A0AAN7AK81_9PEZI|nr:mitochondrial import inner membrane translocase subunit tim21 [Podospora australis]